jgi:uncharacterized membrane-anchored protein
MKKVLMTALVTVIIIQLAVPAFFVSQKYDILRNGTEYKFEVDLYDPYDAFRGRYLAIYPVAQRRIYDTSKTIEGSYGILGVDEEGFAYITEVVKTKPDGEYIRSKSSRYFELPIERYYTDEELAPELERFFTFGPASRSRKEYPPYVIVRVKNGKAVIQGMYIDGIRMEDFKP